MRLHDVVVTAKKHDIHVDGGTSVVKQRGYGCRKSVNFAPENLY